MKLELEFMCEIWNERGEVIEVGPDRDGLDLVEIRFRDNTRPITERISLTREQARLVIQALEHVLTHPAISNETKSE